MPRYHVHLYKVISKAEVGIDAENDTKARQIALEMSKKGKAKFGSPDTDTIAISFGPDETDGKAGG